MNLHADHHFPWAGLAFDEIVLLRSFLHQRYIPPSNVTVIARLDRAIQ